MSRVVGAAAFLFVGLCCLQADAVARGGLSDRTFYVRALGSRCLDFGGQASWAVGSPVFSYECNGTVAQQVRVTELDATHDVELRLQSLYCIGVRGGVVAPGRLLELQRCDGSPAQRFALDGDSILMGAQTSVQARGLSASTSVRVTRDYVVEPQGDSTVARTPLVVGTRELSDAEYFRFQAVDGSGAPPTSGFVRVASEAALDRALSLGWGTVIEVNDRQPLTITGTVPKEIHAGVTLRGYRKYIDQGPLIVHPRDAAFAIGGHAVFEVAEDHVRITGLRLQGPTRADDTGVPKVAGIEIRAGPQLTDVIVDHVDASDWTDGAVNVLGSIVPADPTQCLDTLKYPRPTPVRLADIAVGDFDGDHLSDIFVADGSEWTYAADGKKWTHLAYSPLRTSQLRLGDFTGDGKTDVLTIAANAWRILRGGGTGTPETLRPALTPTLDGLVVADFDGDGIADIARTNGDSWQLSHNGRSGWTTLRAASAPLTALPIGRFDGDKSTDVIVWDDRYFAIAPGGRNPLKTPRRQDMK